MTMRGRASDMMPLQDAIAILESLPRSQFHHSSHACGSATRAIALASLKRHNPSTRNEARRGMRNVVKLLAWLVAIALLLAVGVAAQAQTGALEVVQLRPN